MSLLFWAFFYFMAIVYIHRRKDIEDPFLNVFYVGISKNYRRPTIKYKRNSMWNRIVKKHGYQIEITHQDLCWEEACAIERYLISFYGRHDLGLGNLANMTDGGDGAVNFIRSEEQNKAHSEKMKGENNPMFGRSAQAGRKGFFTGGKHSEETKKRISETLLKKGFRHSEEVKKIISDKLKGRRLYKGDHPCLGRIVSEETRKKISEGNKGKKLTLEQRQKMSENRKGRKFSEEVRKNMSEAKKRDWAKRKQKKYENSLFDASHFNGGDASVCIEKNTGNS
jgi:hypothetical protein